MSPFIPFAQSDMEDAEGANPLRGGDAKLRASVGFEAAGLPERRMDMVRRRVLVLIATLILFAMGASLASASVREAVVGTVSMVADVLGLDDPPASDNDPAPSDPDSDPTDDVVVTRDEDDEDLVAAEEDDELDEDDESDEETPGHTGDPTAASADTSGDTKNPSVDTADTEDDTRHPTADSSDEPTADEPTADEPTADSVDDD